MTELTIDIGSRLELFVDDYLIERLEGAKLVLQRPVPREVAIVHDAPWEGGASTYHSVFRDGDTFRMYYRGAPYRPGGYTDAVTCCAESADGVNWERPNYGLFKHEGSRQNNIVLAPPVGVDEGRRVDDFLAFKDENPEAPDSQKYKAISNVNWRAWGGGIWAFVSPDGVHWERLGEKPVLLDGKEYDGPQGPAFWDPYRGEYHAYLRAWATGDGDEIPKLGSVSAHAAASRKQATLDGNGAAEAGPGQDERIDPDGGVAAWRTVRHCTSDDFVNWTRPTLVQFDSPLSMDEQLYTNAIQPYFRAPHIYIGVPKRFAPFRHKVLEHPGTGVSDGGFMTSRGGVHWKRWEEAFILPGLDRKNWLDRNTLPACGVLETGPDEISVYWTEHYNSDACRVRRGTLRTDGFVSVNAGYGGGELVSRPFTFQGRELVINYSTSAFGSVQVEIQDAAGSVLDGYSLAQCPVIYGDAIEHSVSWDGGSDVSALAEKPVRLRFALRDADLYSLRFR